MPLRPDAISRSVAPLRSGTLHNGILALLVFVCVALIGTETWQLWQVYRANIEQSDIVSSNTARAMAEQAETTLQTADTVVATLVKQVEEDGTSPEALSRFYRLMTSLAVALPAIHEMGVVDSKGNAIAKSLKPDPHGLNYADREYFHYHATHPDQGPFIGARIQSKIDGTYSITVTRRINNPDGTFGGLAVTSVSLDFFQQLFSRVQAKSGGIISLVADDNTTLARSPPAEPGVHESPDLDNVRRRLDDDHSSRRLSYVSGVDGVWRRGSYEHLSHFPMSTLVSQSEWDVQRSWRTELITHAIILACVMFALIIFGWQAFLASRMLATLAMYDGLTGLPNRRALDETMELEIRRGARSGQRLSIILIDVDHFKSYNDCFGHPAGDDCLRVIARTIQGCLRRSGEFAARFGGEEFAVLLPGSDQAGTFALAETIRRAVIAAAIQHSVNRGGVVTVSAGVGTVMPGRNSEDSQMLVRIADTALYAAKAAGRNTVQSGRIITPTMLDSKLNSLSAVGV